jgi:kynurenine 3-monooxygenase
LSALGALGWKDEVLAFALPMYGRMVHDSDGSQHYQQYDPLNRPIYSVSRRQLNEWLIGKLEQMPQVRCRFGYRCTDMEVGDPEIVIEGQRDDGSGFTEHADVVFGADGIHSFIRRWLDERGGHPSQMTVHGHGYMELSMPPGRHGRWAINPSALHIWSGAGGMMIALPNADYGCTCTLFMPLEGAESFQSLSEASRIKAYFRTYYEELNDLVPDIATQFLQRTPSTLCALDVPRWHYEDKVLVIGDAAHAIYPFFGQGMNAGFEDCHLFDGLLERSPNIQDAIQSFGRMRKPDTATIAALSDENFLEMKEKTRDPLYIRKKNLLDRMALRSPDRWQSLYSMVSFSDLPYAEAWARHQRQEALLDMFIEKTAYALG